jgi:uncharacterized C2H2 Zn-finger protein
MILTTVIVKMKTVNNLKSRRLQKKTSDQVKYKCPECSKVLKTISGFRGHVKKQHNIDGRATDNKVTSGNKSDNTFSCQDDHFSQIFPSAYQSSLKNIANDPFLPSKQISNISVMAASSDSIRMRLEKEMNLTTNFFNMCTEFV